MNYRAVAPLITEIWGTIPCGVYLLRTCLLRRSVENNRMLRNPPALGICVSSQFVTRCYLTSRSAKRQTEYMWEDRGLLRPEMCLTAPCEQGCDFTVLLKITTGTISVLGPWATEDPGSVILSLSVVPVPTETVLSWAKSSSVVTNFRPDISNIVTSQTQRSQVSAFLRILEIARDPSRRTFQSRR